MSDHTDKCAAITSPPSNHSNGPLMQPTPHTFCSSICKTNNPIKLKYRHGQLQHKNFYIFPVMQQYTESLHGDWWCVQIPECHNHGLFLEVCQVSSCRALALLTLQVAQVVIKVRTTVSNALPRQTHITPWPGYVRKPLGVRCMYDSDASMLE